MGNLVLWPGAETEQRRPDLLLVAHMDEVGLVTTGYAEAGRLRFRRLGAVPDSALEGAPVVIYGQGGETAGFVRRRHHRGEDEWWIEPESAPPAGHRPLPVSLAKGDRVLRGRWLCGKGLDDRLGCAVLVELAGRLARSKPSNFCVALAWTVQDEIGLRGARALASILRPRAAISVDALDADRADLDADDALVLRLYDDRSLGDDILLERLERVARELGLPVKKCGTPGASEVEAFRRVGARVAALNFPVWGIHTGAERVSRAAAGGLAGLLDQFIPALAACPAI